MLVVGWGVLTVPRTQQPAHHDADKDDDRPGEGLLNDDVPVQMGENVLHPHRQYR